MGRRGEDADVMSLRGFSDRLAMRLFEFGVVKTRDQSPGCQGFRIKDHETNSDAPLSPVFLDFRLKGDPVCPGPVTPEQLTEIGWILYGMARMNHLDYACVSAVPNSANPYAEAFSSGCSNGKIRLLKLGKEVDPESGKKKIVRITDGNLKCCESVLLITEVIDRGESTLEAASVIEASGLRVYDILAIVDRSRGGSSRLRDQGYNVYCLFEIRELLELYLYTRKIGNADFYEMMHYLHLES